MASVDKPQMDDGNRDRNHKIQPDPLVRDMLQEAGAMLEHCNFGDVEVRIAVRDQQSETILYAHTLDTSDDTTSETLRETMDKIRLFLMLLTKNNCKDAICAYMQNYGAGEPIQIVPGQTLNECIIHAISQRDLPDIVLSRAKYHPSFIQKNRVKTNDSYGLNHEVTGLAEKSPKILAYWFDENDEFYILQTIVLPSAHESTIGTSICHIRICDEVQKHLEGIVVYEDSNDRTGHTIDVDKRIITSDASGRLLTDAFIINELREHMFQIQSEHGDICIILEEEYDEESIESHIRHWKVKVYEHRSLRRETKNQLNEIDAYIKERLFPGIDAVYSPAMERDELISGKPIEFIWNKNLSKFSDDLCEYVRNMLKGNTHIEFSYDVECLTHDQTPQIVIKLFIKALPTNASPETPN